MFNSVTLRGGPASLVWGYRTVAALTTWRISQTPEGGWRLTATLAARDKWQVEQAAKMKELLFTAPRDRGRWCWALEQIDIGTTELRAILGPPLN